MIKIFAPAALLLFTAPVFAQDNSPPATTQKPPVMSRKIPPPPVPLPPPGTELLRTDAFFKKNIGTAISYIRIAEDKRGVVPICNVSAVSLLAQAAHRCWPALSGFRDLQDMLEYAAIYGDEKKAGALPDPVKARNIVAMSDTLIEKYGAREFPAHEFVLTSAHFIKAFVLSDLGETNAALAEIDTLEALDQNRTLDRPDFEKKQLDMYRALILIQKAQRQ